MVDLLPIILWVLSSLWSAGVCMICVIRGKLLSGERRPDVDTVSWNVIYAQVCSVVFAAVPFMALILIQDDIGRAMMDFYERFLYAGAAASVILVIAAWAFMFVQAKRAERTQMERMLRRK
ncbi:C4-dicarboxylate ABC transporter [Bifidobacterium aerophilum]|uniref:C4-dicarboxylate ABC transporter n=1 Tax=Bifidobacterium aerophilum TaxID=1798155 RepID=A0A6N9Z435_9BIFI|nr:C4-dicarboxylate ABC transporter [Bifidobacterium aerophilum]NEG89226.1 C4-dicarboxylate ABC transporter [Bifidobacterium aerophilum]